MAENKKKSAQTASDPATTGHVWDGVQEFNNPLPRWWLLIFYATIIWAVAYWIVYPAWPLISSHTQGLFQWNSRTAVKEDISALQAQRAATTQRLASATPAEIVKSPELVALARAQGRATFLDNCAGCHGVGAAGAKGYPNLNDDEWIWGGTLKDIEQTIRYGVRFGHEKGWQGPVMPAFGRENLLKNREIESTADFVRTLAGLQVDPKADIALGAKVFEQQCSSCHGSDGKGKSEVGAPNLTDAIWLYGSDRKTIIEGIVNGRGGVMPSWDTRLDDITIKSLTVFVHTLGGGK